MTAIQILLTMVTDQAPYTPGPRNSFGIFLGNAQIAEVRAHGVDEWAVYSPNALGSYTKLETVVGSRVEALASQVAFAEEVAGVEEAYQNSLKALR